MIGHDSDRGDVAAVPVNGGWLSSNEMSRIPASLGIESGKARATAASRRPFRCCADNLGEGANAVSEILMIYEAAYVS
jgi:hypothetical protein